MTPKQIKDRIGQLLSTKAAATDLVIYRCLDFNLPLLHSASFQESDYKKTIWYQQDEAEVVLVLRHESREALPKIVYCRNSQGCESAKFVFQYLWHILGMNNRIEESDPVTAAMLTLDSYITDHDLEEAAMQRAKEIDATNEMLNDWINKGG